MTDSTKHLIKSLIDKVSEEEKDRVLGRFDEMSSKGKARSQMLKPLIAILEEVKNSPYTGITIHTSSDINLSIDSPSGGDYYEFTANPDNSSYIVHERHFFEGAIDKKSYSYTNLDDLVSFIIEVVGKQVGKEDAYDIFKNRFKKSET